MNFNSDFSHDLELGQVFEKGLATILTSRKIEVKRDFKAMKTGNVFVEYSSRGKPSGLATTNADYYCYFIAERRLIILPTEELKELCRPFLYTNRDVRGGDNNTSKGVLLPITAFITGAIL